MSTTNNGSSISRQRTKNDRYTLRYELTIKVLSPASLDPDSFEWGEGLTGTQEKQNPTLYQFSYILTSINLRNCSIKCGRRGRLLTAVAPVL